MFGIKKPLKVAAWGYIVLVIISLLIFFLDLSAFTVLFSLALVFTLLVLFNGFAELGKTVKNRFLVFTSYLLGAITIVCVLYLIFLSEGDEDIIFNILLLVLSFLTILFGIALFNLREKVNLAGTAGVINIALGTFLFIFPFEILRLSLPGTTEIFVGFGLVYFVVSLFIVPFFMLLKAVFEIILLFKSSSRLEN